MIHPERRLTLNIKVSVPFYLVEFTDDDLGPVTLSKYGLLKVARNDDPPPDSLRVASR